MKKSSVKKRVATILLAVLAAVSLGLACFFMSTPNTNVVGAFTSEHTEAFGSASGHDPLSGEGDNITETDLKTLTATDNVITIDTAGSYYLSADLNAALVIDISDSGDDKTVYLCLNGHVLDAFVANTSAITVESGALVLHDCMENSTNDDHQHTYYVNKHGKYEFDDGSEEWDTAYAAAADDEKSSVTGGVITGGTGTVSTNNKDEDTTYGGGIFLEGSGASLTMYGGTIAGNMAKRDITETGYSPDDATYGGGVYVGGGKTFNMYGGTIEGNTAGSSSNGTTAEENNDLNNDHDRGGGVAVNGGTFNMYGGTIKNNAADDGAGVYASGDSSFTMYGDIANTQGEGTYSPVISGNNARHNGGGVYLNQGTAQIGGTVDGTAYEGGSIENNTALSFDMHPKSWTDFWRCMFSCQEERSLTQSTRQNSR